MTTVETNTQELHVIYQSNEAIPATGLYQVVESRPAERPVKQTGHLEAPYAPTTLHLVKDEVFPNFEGRSVAWRLLNKD